MVPAEGGASPEAMLLASMPTGSFSMKLLYMVQAGFQAEAQGFECCSSSREWRGCHCAAFTSFWFHAVDSGLTAARQLDGSCYAGQQPPATAANHHDIRLGHHL